MSTLQICTRWKKRKNKRLFFNVCLILVVILLGILFFYIIDFIQMKMKQNDLYEQAIQMEKQKIMDNQSFDGAIFTYYDKEQNTEYKRYVNPYFACIAARGLLRSTVSLEQKEAVKQYIEWHIEHLEPDGSIQDYQLTYNGDKCIMEEKEEPDSIDSYAAMFLTLVEEYYEVTKDSSYLNEIATTIDLVTSRLLGVINESGLAMNNETARLCYLMDNIEVQKGLLNCCLLYKEALKDITGLNLSYETVKLAYDKNINAIEKYLWKNDTYIVGIDENGQELGILDYTKIYPYWSTQLYPQIFDYAGAKEERGSKIYQDFCSKIDWTSLNYRQKSNSSYWCMLAYAAAKK